MSRTITLRLDDEVYRRLRTLAERDNRPLSNFIETATLRFLESELLTDEFETEELQTNAVLKQSIKRGHRDAAARRGRFV